MDASDRFLKALEGAIEPERKRRIIGDTFIQVFEDEAKRLDPRRHAAAQGTIYRTRSKPAARNAPTRSRRTTIAYPSSDDMIRAGRVVEPIRDLYKVEVREMAEALDIAPELVWRHPFPGPGLGVRLLCSDGRVPPATIRRRRSRSSMRS